ncbi:MAG TPA: metallophosphoesterase [Gemmataceae bacterium]
MIIGVISDTHDRQDRVAAALRRFGAEGVGLVIHCGDITSPETVYLFAGAPAHFVLGNCDWHADALRRAVAEIGGTLHEPFGELELGGRRIAWLHGDDARLKQNLESGGEYDFLFYGHTHRAAEHRTGKTRVINPGALQRVDTPTCGVLDTGTWEFRRIEVVREEA